MSQEVPLDKLPPQMRQPTAAPNQEVPADKLPVELTQSVTPPPAKDDGKLGDTASAIVRPIAKAVIGAAYFFQDTAAQLYNAATESDLPLNLFGASLDLKGMPKAPVVTPFLEGKLDEHTTKPDTMLGKGAEEVNTALLSGGVAESGKKLATSAAKEAPRVLNKITSRAAELAQEHGFKSPPSYIGGPITKGAQSAVGKARVEREFAEANEAAIDRLAKRDLGLHADNELDEHTFDMLKNEAYAPYEKIRGLGKIATDAMYHDDIVKAGGRFASGGKSFGGDRFDSIAKLKARYLTGEFEAGDAIDEIKQLRKMSKGNLSKYDPEQNAIGYTQREIANALEDRIDRFAEQSGSPGLGKELQDARRKLAKIFTVEDATGTGGHVKAHDLLNAYKKGAKLDGGLETIAKVAHEFPKATVFIADKGKEGAFSVLDYALGGSGLLEGEPALAALAATRPLTRKVLGSKVVQDSMIKRLKGEDPSSLDAFGLLGTGEGINRAEDLNSGR